MINEPQGIIPAGKFQFEAAALGKIHLVGSQCKFTTNSAPYLHINLGP